VLTILIAFASPATSERPLYPSVEFLLHTHNLSASDIKATGPGGRLLKGDVLAHLGQIPASAPEAISKRFSKLSHLDLSNITPAAPKPAKAPAVAEPAEVEAEYELALPIDLKPVLQLQQRLQDTIGHAPPLSELLARAIGLANTNLPASPRPLSADELFDEIVGSSTHRALHTTHGNFLPLINNIPSALPFITEPVDVLDELIGASPRTKALVPPSARGAQAGAVNDFSVTVPAEDRKRAMVFLQRVKSVLEVEPGRLVL
jgi:e3 binding domain